MMTTIEPLKTEASAPSNFSCEPTHEEISLRAYCLWERSGKPQGRELGFWLRAEAELRLENAALHEAITATEAIAKLEAKASRPLKTVKTKRRFSMVD